MAQRTYRAQLMRAANYLAWVALAAFCGLAPLAASGQKVPPADPGVHRALATRPQLDSLRRALEAKPGDQAARSQLAALKTRLETGDFQPGDMILLSVQGEEALTDTFVVSGSRSLLLPAPAVGEMSLRGVLRSELDQQAMQFVSRFVRTPVVRAQPLIRISVQGEVARPGYYGVPADAPISTAVMAAGGTTSAADPKKWRVARNGQTVLDGEPLQRAIAEGRTIEDSSLRPGDEILIGKRKEGTFMESARLLSFMVSIVGGIYGLSRIF